MLIGGDAGVGKSRLVREFGTGAAPAVRVLTGRCPDLGQVGLPFAPFSAVLRDLVRDRAFAGVIGAPDRELIRLLPELGKPAAAGPVTGGPAAAGPAAGGPAVADSVAGGPAAGGTAKQARARLFVEMLSLLEQLARSRPTVLVVEDAHWADESTRDLIFFLIDNLQAMPGLLVIVTYRSDELHRGHPLCAQLRRLGRLGWVQRTELSGLSRDESAELVGHILGSQPPPSLADRVHRTAQGNPLLTEELVCCDGQRSACAATPRGLMLAAIRRLPEPTQDVLRTASAGGQRTGRGLLAAVTGLDATALEASLRPAVGGGVLVADDDSCIFRHALISEAIHQDLLPGDHTAVHHRFAAALQEDPSLAPAGCAAIEQAEHWHHAHDPALALSSAWRAAAEAGRALACAEQLAMLARVLELWPSVPDAERLTGADHALVLRRAAEAAHAAGDGQLGTALGAAAQDGAGAYPDPDGRRGCFGA